MADLRARVASVLVAGCALVACARSVRPPVAPFGGALATPLPHADVIGLVRTTPSDDACKLLQQGLAAAGPLISVLEPAGCFLAMQKKSGFLRTDQPFALFLLDTTVHGALVGFAWRGDAEAFLAEAKKEGRASGDGQIVFLDGRARIDGLDDLMEDALRRRRRGDSDEPLVVADPQSIDGVRFHVVERGGTTLLVPARDGVGHLLDTLAATRLLEPETGDASLLRLELGAVVGEMRDFLINWSQLAFSGLASKATAQLNDNPELQRKLGHASQDFTNNELDWRLVEPFYDLSRASIDLGESLNHLFVLRDGASVDLFLQARAGAFGDQLLPLSRNLPLKELLAGAPAEAPLLVAEACDPKRIGDGRSIWEATRDDPFGERRRRNRRRFVRGAGHVSVESDVGAEESGEDEATFMKSFGGRQWLAVDVGASQSFRLFSSMVDDECSEGALFAAARRLLTPEELKAAQLAALRYYAPTRVTDGLLEVVGLEASDIVSAEAERIERNADVAIPDGALDPAFLYARLAGMPESDGSESLLLTMAAGDHGLHVRVTKVPGN